MKLSKVMIGLVIGVAGLGLFAPVPSVGQGGRTWTVCRQGCDFQRIQEAIDAAADGDTILIYDPGIYYENLTVAKSLRIAPYQSSVFPVIIQPKEAFAGPVITVNGERAIRVTLENLIVQGVAAEQAVAMLIAGQAQVLLNDVEVGPSVYFGLRVGDQAQVTIKRSRFRESTSGITVGDSARVIVEDSVIFANRIAGIAIGGEGWLHVIRSTIFGTRLNTLTLGTGIEASDKAKVILEESQVYDNRSYGIAAFDSSTVEILNSAVAYHDISGILLEEKANLMVKESVIHNNSWWGISAWLIKCGFDRDWYSGTVQIDPSTVLVKNSKGDICLP